MRARRPHPQPPGRRRYEKQGLRERRLYILYVSFVYPAKPLNNSKLTYFFPAAAGRLAYLRRKRSTRPAVSKSFCLPVKKGWQAEQISTWTSPRCVDRVVKVLPQAQCTRTS